MATQKQTIDVARSPLDLALSQLREGRDDRKYYALTLLGEDGRMNYGLQSRWAGFTDTIPRREIRAPRLLTKKFAELWSAIDQPYAFIHDEKNMMLYILGGGNALIEKELFETSMPQFLTPEVAIANGFAGFCGAETFEKTAFNRQPTPKLRMKVISRDAYRCRICGRKPDDNIDIRLHVHHIRPWADGGVTDMKNLITLCQTCHDGLNPHYDPNLHQYVDDGELTSNVARELSLFLNGVIEYRKIIRTTIKEIR